MIVNSMPDNVLVFTREFGEDRVTVALNTGREERKAAVNISDTDVIVSANAELTVDGICLKKYGFAVLANK
ncbi:MAG: hypothetical protein IJ391_01455 [Clostridia bacterium]|nr:hypothetical protein [Clostridia bacterium]